MIEYLSKHIKLIDIDGAVFIGTVGDYIYPEDNAPSGEEALVLDIEGFVHPIQFDASEI